MVHTGSCFCGEVTFRLEDKPMFVHCCHCRDCQRQTGTAFALNAMIEADKVTLLSGAPEPVAMRTDSGNPHDIWRCPKCRCAVWSDYGYRVVLFVRVTALEDPSAVPPDVHIFTRSKLPWLTLPEGVPAFAEFYDRAKLWPAASLARLKAAMEKR
jgi:hypothetical protein